MIKLSSGLMRFAIATIILFSTTVKADDLITCPSIEKAATLAEMKATHYGGTEWEIKSKDEGVFYVSVGYENCVFRFVANLSHFIPNLRSAGDEWDKAEKIGSLIENDGRVLLVHPVVLPFGSEKTLSYNIRMFDYLASKAIANAIASKSKKTRSSWNSL